jgi:hypothetical protein
MGLSAATFAFWSTAGIRMFPQASLPGFVSTRYLPINPYTYPAGHQPLLSLSLAIEHTCNCTIHYS